MSKFKKETEDNIILNLKRLVIQEKTAREISKILGISRMTIYRRCKSFGIHLKNKHNELKFDNTVFDNINTEEKAYWLGFLFADGNVGSNTNIVTLTLASKDRDHLIKYQEFLKNRGKIYDKEYSNFYSSSVSVCNKHFKEQLVSLGCKERKSLILDFPKLSIFSNSTLIYHFIRGYVDGDGCLSYSRNGRLHIQILGTKEFLSKVQEIIPDKMHLYKIKRLKSNTYTLNCCGNNADYVANLLYKNAKIYLERKYNRFVVLCRNT